jgi:hypothetical protein
MVSLGFIATILTANFVSALSTAENGLVSECAEGKRTSYLFEKK